MAVYKTKKYYKFWQNFSSFDKEDFWKPQSFVSQIWATKWQKQQIECTPSEDSD